MIASGVVQSYADILSYTSCTLLSTEQQQALTAHVESAPQVTLNLQLHPHLTQSKPLKGNPTLGMGGDTLILVYSYIACLPTV